MKRAESLGIEVDESEVQYPPGGIKAGEFHRSDYLYQRILVEHLKTLGYAEHEWDEVAT